MNARRERPPFNVPVLVDRFETRYWEINTDVSKPSQLLEDLLNELREQGTFEVLSVFPWRTEKVTYPDGRVYEVTNVVMVVLRAM